MSDTIGAVMLAVGILFNLAGCLGMVRLPDVYNRLQAATKCVTLGTCLVLGAVAVLTAGQSAAIALRGALCIVFIVITSPTAAHALARGAHASGVKLWEGSVADAYAADGEPGAAREETE
ncbi:MAG: Na+/H+ antiporter subunit G [Lentisphaerae bacterium]|nr:Na+/H+ antiporter subunit G [Lentisphaerota bacterium]